MDPERSAKDWDGVGDGGGGGGGKIRLQWYGGNHVKLLFGCGVHTLYINGGSLSVQSLLNF